MDENDADHSEKIVKITPRRAAARHAARISSNAHTRNPRDTAPTHRPHSRERTRTFTRARVRARADSGS